MGTFIDVYTYIDVDEYAQTVADYDPNTECINTNKSFECKCNDKYDTSDESTVDDNPQSLSTRIKIDTLRKSDNECGENSYVYQY